MACVHAKLLQSCLTLCGPLDCSPAGSSVCGILQARIPEGVAISFFRGSSRRRDGTHIFCVPLPLSHLGSPYQNTMDSTPKIMPLIKLARLKIFFLLIYICPSDSQLLRPSLFFTHAKFYLNLSLKKLDNSSEKCPSYPLQCECRAEDVFQIF